MRQNFSYNLAGTVVFTLAQWLMLAVLARQGSPAVVGQFTYALAITAPIFLFASFNLRSVQATDVGGRFAFGDYLGHRLVAGALAFVLSTATAVLANDAREIWKVTALVAAAKFFDMLSDVAYGLLQREERMDRIAGSRVLQGTLQLIALGWTFTATHSLMAACGAWAIASATTTILYDRRAVAWILLRRPRPESHLPRWIPCNLKELTLLSLPLTGTAALGQVGISVPRIVLEHAHGASWVGVFSALQYLTAALGLVLGAVNQAALPRLASAYAASFTQFRRLTLLLIGVSCSCGLFAFLVAKWLGRPLLDMAYGAKFSHATHEFTWLAGLSTLSLIASALSFAVTAAWEFRGQLLAYTIASTVHIAGSLLWIPKYGIIGAVFAVGCGNAVLALTMGIVWSRLTPTANGEGARLGQEVPL